MKIRITQAGGFWGISLAIDKGKKQLVSLIENSEIELKGTETLLFTDRVLKKCIVDLNKYDKDISIIVFATSGSGRGMVSAVITLADDFIEVINNK